MMVYSLHPVSMLLTSGACAVPPTWYSARAGGCTPAQSSTGAALAPSSPLSSEQVRGTNVTSAPDDSVVDSKDLALHKR